ncbi:MAG: winged helix DNA-binding domain-containing protein [Chloroflexota bacterium]
MPNPQIATRRLNASGLLTTRFASPAEVVRWSGAVQSQDYPGASWGIGQRLGPVARQADIDASFDAGEIVRTHALRPTWHFLHPADIRWILRLTSPRVHRLNALYYRRLELDGSTRARGTDVVARALEGGRHLTRVELGAALARAGIEPAGRIGYLLIHAELDGVVVSGPRRGRQFTYALLDERVPASPGTRAFDDRDAALAELTRRYFSSHGPAQPPDFAWWASLTLGEAREGLALAGDGLVRERIDDADWWWVPPPGGEPSMPPGGPLVHLLPNYDEYLGSYRDHRPTFDAALLGARWVEEVFAAHLVVRDGMAIGGWRRENGRREVVVRPDLLVELDLDGRAALAGATAWLGSFAGLEARLADRADLADGGAWRVR